MALPAVSLIAAPLLARALEAGGRGEYASVSMSLFLAVSLATGGIPEAIVYFLSRRRVEPHRVLGLAIRGLMVTSLVATLVLLASATLLSDGSGVVRDLIVLASAAIAPSCLVAVGRAVASARQEWHLVNAERYLSAATRLAGFSALFLAGRLTVGSAVLVAVLSLVLPGVVYLGMVRNRTPAGTAQPTLQAMAFTRFAGVNGMAVVTAVLLARFDQVALAPLSGAAQLGLYAVAASVAEAPQLVTWAAREVMLSHDADLEDAGSVAKAARAVFLVTAGLVVVLAVCLPWGLPLVFGAGFAGSVTMTWILLLGVAVAAPGNVVSAVLVARGRPGQRVAALGTALLVDVALLLALAPTLGGEGAAWAMCAASAVATVLHLVFFCRLTGTRWTEVLPRASDVRSIIRR